MTRTTDEINRLLGIMRALRAPDGCPWDRQQTFASIVPYTLEEAYEVAEAIARDDMAELRDELGDLLFQVVFHSQLADERGAFGFADVAAAIGDKLERRHPHVFGDEAVRGDSHLRERWESHKERERGQKREAVSSVLDDIPLALPALSRALKIGRRVARVGFDWPDHTGALDKIEEEVAELRAEVENTAPRERMFEELGDLLFALVNLARKLDIDPEAALRAANAKFERRFRAVEGKLAESGKRPRDSTLEEMDALWNEIKSMPK